MNASAGLLMFFACSLGSEDFGTRDRSRRVLETAGPLSLPVAVVGTRSGDPEVARACRMLLPDIDPGRVRLRCCALWLVYGPEPDWDYLREHAWELCPLHDEVLRLGLDMGCLQDYDVRSFYTDDVAIAWKGRAFEKRLETIRGGVR
jgi:hypothetical protein